MWPYCKHMTNNNLMIDEYSYKLLERIRVRIPKGQRTYGFEYEFIPSSPLDLDRMEQLYAFLPGYGFKRDGNYFVHANGMYISFEPGGQIEYDSVPLLPEDRETFRNSLAFISYINAEIQSHLGIEYLGTGYVPDRGNTPLCLTSDRYRYLHDRLSKSGSRGHEMMKSTASIHLHACIMDIDELPRLFSCFYAISKMEDFSMQPERRDIWNNTDPSRCALPFEHMSELTDPFQVARELVRVAAGAYVLGKEIPYYELENKSFNDFLNHMTTIFTDVRLNIKGPTFELRTLDSMPMENFERIWDKLISIIESQEVC